MSLGHIPIKRERKKDREREQITMFDQQHREAINKQNRRKERTGKHV